MWLFFQADQLWISGPASAGLPPLPTGERCELRTDAGRRGPQPALAGGPGSRESLCEAEAGRRAVGPPPRADTRRTTRRARVRPMHAWARGPAVPGSANDRWAGCGPIARPGRVLLPHQPDRVPVTGVQAGSQCLRGAASHGPAAVAVPAKQQTVRHLRLARPRPSSILRRGASRMGANERVGDELNGAQPWLLHRRSRGHETVGCRFACLQARRRSADGPETAAPDGSALRASRCLLHRSI